jgi:hypothetical protein
MAAFVFFVGYVPPWYVLDRFVIASELFEGKHGSMERGVEKPFQAAAAPVSPDPGDA